jgi:hypothetical protein
LIEDFSKRENNTDIIALPNILANYSQQIEWENVLGNPNFL